MRPFGNDAGWWNAMGGLVTDVEVLIRI